MRLDWELARRGYRRYAAYPGATYAGLFTNVFFGFLIASILLAVYDQREVVGGYDVADAMAYVWLAQGLLSVVASFGPSWSELALRVRSGDVATDLYRPVDLQRALFAQARQYPGQERQFLEFVQKNPQALQQLRAPLFEDRVVDYILELAKVTERAVSKDELQKAVEALDEDAAALTAPQEASEA